MADNTYPGLAKIHRQTAMLTVEPPVVLQGREVSVIVRPFEEKDLLLSVFDAGGNLLTREEIPGTGLYSRLLEIPGEDSGTVSLLLQAEEGNTYITLDSVQVALLPDFLKNVNDLVQRIEAVEKRENISAGLLRGAWAALAYAEDLLERAKQADVSSIWDLNGRLAALENRTVELEAGKDSLLEKPGYQLRGYRSPLNDQIQLYSMYLPKNYNSEEAFPLVIMLHGAWSNHHLALRRVFGQSNRPAEDDAAAKKTMPALPDVPFLVACPNGYETMSYEGFAEDDVWRVIEEMQTLYHVDLNRIYLTGLSMGGLGTAKLAFKHPDRFAAIAPVCGLFGSDVDLANLENLHESQRRAELMNSSYQLAENALHLPVKLMHGEADPVVPVRNSIRLNEKLNELGYKTEIELYPGVQHDARSGI